MTINDQGFDRALPRLFVELASASTPDYLEAAIEHASSRPQRPAWTYPGRWLPMDITTMAVPAARMPWRQFGILALIGLLLAVAAFAYVGARRGPSPAPPFGLAGNGVIAVGKDGDIFIADRPGGDLRLLVAGPEEDGSPMFSPDGTRLAFVRRTGLSLVLMVADADGTNVVQLTPETLDASGWTFAPDGRSLLAVAVIDGEPDGPDSELGNAPKRVLIRPVDPAAALTVLEIPLWDSWMEISESGGPSIRPTNPQEILMVTQLDPGGQRGIHVYDLATGAIRTVVEPAGYVHDVAWSQTGEHISYDLSDSPPVRARVVAADGSGDRALDNAPGTIGDEQVSPWSNDGTRIVIYRAREAEADAQTVVVSTNGDGEPVELACGPTKDIECAGSWIWSPDDTTLIGPGVDTSLQADPDTGQVTELDWHELDRVDDPQAWQRVAP